LQASRSQLALAKGGIDMASNTSSPVACKRGGAAA
jgi:hypothetical protein